MLSSLLRRLCPKSELPTVEHVSRAQVVLVAVAPSRRHRGQSSPCGLARAAASPRDVARLGRTCWPNREVGLGATWHVPHEDRPTAQDGRPEGAVSLTRGVATLHLYIIH